jgi:NAD(P)-dependent dehydrogenase (short-subunit alcohol dehydrogenase family)
MDVGDYFKDGLLAGKVALVTGGGSGIGLELARGLGRVGAHVVLASRSVERLEGAAGELRAQGIDASYRSVNARDSDAVYATVDDVLAEHGKIDILVNNAGGTFPKKAEELTPNGFRTIVDLNLNGTFYFCSAVGRHLIERGEGGKMLNVVIGTVDRASGGIAHTGASRAGVAHLTRSLAQEWARFNIQVNAIGPQYMTPAAAEMYGSAVTDFITSITPARRWARPDEIGAFAVVLCSPMSDYVTGVSIPIDGGNWIGPGMDFRGSEVLPE